MQINDNLSICLRALETRYPIHFVDINEALLGPQSFAAAGWTSPTIIAQLEKAAPELLQARARLVIDAQKSEIYLLERSEQLPALIIHCRGNLPAFSKASLNDALEAVDNIPVVEALPIIASAAIS